MKLGVCLPNWMPHKIDHRSLDAWAVLADESGFFLLATIDRPNGDSWDPLITLAGVAMRTKQIRLGPMILQLPNRNAVLVAKQAATIDRLSGGRFVLGVGAAGRRDDFAVFGANFQNRWLRFPTQIEQIRQIWEDASSADPSDPILGPAPVQTPGPPIWLAATGPETMKRAISLGDALILSQGADAIPSTGTLVEWLRSEAAQIGREEFHISRVMFVALGKDAARTRAEGLQNIDRFYNVYTWTGVENMLSAGSPEDIGEAVAALADASLDSLVLIPAISDIEQLELLAETVLPRYRESFALPPIS